MYYCEICQPEFANDPAVANINLSSIEHHRKYTITITGLDHLETINVQNVQFLEY
jgi:hypothetical protein